MADTRPLGNDEVECSKDGFACAKGSNFQSAIDERAAGMGAQGDNCSGPPNFLPV